MEVLEYIKLGASLLGWILSVILVVFKICRNAKNKSNEQLKNEIIENLIPLMEQAERAFDNGNDKENWVIKKLGEVMHYDFFKHKKLLTLVKNLISEICATTQIEVNKERIVQVKNTTEKGTNENGIY